MATRVAKVIASLALMASTSFAWQGPFPQALPSRLVTYDSSTDTLESSLLRRAFLLSLTPSLLSVPQIANAVTVSSSNLSFTQTATGLQYADIKVGPGSPAIQRGSTVSVEYILSTTGAKFGNRIYSSTDAGAPYQWTFGDGSTIPGLEEAVSTMATGGIRRVIIPSKLAYQAASSPTTEECQNGLGIGPRPSASEKAFHPLMFQRFNNIYCNADSQPDLIMDVELLK